MAGEAITDWSVKCGAINFTYFEEMNIRVAHKDKAKDFERTRADANRIPYMRRFQWVSQT